jgi:hypothetical protein
VRIALRTSGGRGEYELTGTHADVQASDLFDRLLSFRVSPELTIEGRSRPMRVQGKPRIRLEDGGVHAYRILTDVLLMPLPRRELRETVDGPDFVRDRGYAVSEIDVDLVRQWDGEAELRPTRLLLTNSAGLGRGVEFAERMAIVQAVWEAARGHEGRIATHVQDHEAAVESGDHARIRSAASAVRGYYGTGTDVLPLVAVDLGTEVEDTAVNPTVAIGEIADDGVEDDTDPSEAVRREISKWRRQAARGPAGRRFAESVKAAYDYRCAFCGRRYPKLESAASSGVDGAHILPWARYDLNSVMNGLSLCKGCHWAFDNGILRLDWRRGAKRYVLSIPRTVRTEARAVNFDLTHWGQLEGRLPAWHLPESDALWPSPTYIDELNKQLYS